jgi:hypothetical protein
MKSIFASILPLLLCGMGMTEVQAATNLTRICYYQPMSPGCVIVSGAQHWECG